MRPQDEYKSPYKASKRGKKVRVPCLGRYCYPEGKTFLSSNPKTNRLCGRCSGNPNRPPREDRIKKLLTADSEAI